MLSLVVRKKYYFAANDCRLNCPPIKIKLRERILLNEQERLPTGNVLAITAERREAKQEGEMVCMPCGAVPCQSGRASMQGVLTWRNVGRVQKHAHLQQHLAEPTPDGNYFIAEMSALGSPSVDD